MVNAQHTFYNGTTEVTVKRNDLSIRQNVGPLHSVSNPEDKRKIIGDMFVRVRRVLSSFSVGVNGYQICLLKGRPLLLDSILLGKR